MYEYKGIMNEVEDIYNYFYSVNNEIARCSSDDWVMSEAYSQLGTLSLILKRISENIESYSAEELKDIIYHISKAQNEIFKLL